MIVTVTLNPSVDIKYEIDNFNINGVHRVNSTVKTAGGKGLNVTRVINKLGVNVIATGFLGGELGSFISNSLSKDNIEHNFINIKQDTRNCINILSEDKSTEILEKGPFISENEWLKFKEEYKSLVEKNESVILSGSLPLGLGVDSYCHLIKIARESNCKVFLDTSGKTLEKSLGEKPNFIKPNLEELEMLVGKKLDNIEEIIYEGKKLSKLGIDIIAITLGANGSVIITENKVYKVDIPKFKVVNTVGSGDSFVAGFVSGYSQKLEIEETIKLAVASSISNALQANTGDIDIEEIEKIKGLIKIKVLEE